MSELNISLSQSGLVGISPENKPAEVEKSPVAATQQQVVKQEQKEQAEVPLSAQETEAAVEKMNSLLQDMKRNLSFSVDEASGENIILVKDAESDEVIRQIPSEELLVLRKKMDDVVGLLFDTKV